MTDLRRGRFINFEGLDGCGKTTQMHRLAARLRAEGFDVVETVEPGGTRIGNRIRAILLDPAHQELFPTAEMLLYFAARAQNVDQIIRPALEQGRIVLSDRFTDSTMAYQGLGRGLGEDLVNALDAIACRGLRPDLTILVDIDLETGLERSRSRGAADRMDAQDEDFQRRVREAYLRMAAREPHRFRLIDGRGAESAVAGLIYAAVTG